jgi:hypothetical protein
MKFAAFNNAKGRNEGRAFRNLLLAGAIMSGCANESTVKPKGQESTRTEVAQRMQCDEFSKPPETKMEVEEIDDSCFRREVRSEVAKMVEECNGSLDFITAKAQQPPKRSPKPAYVQFLTPVGGMCLGRGPVSSCLET